MFKVSTLILQTRVALFMKFSTAGRRAQLPTNGKTENNAPIFYKFWYNLGLLERGFPENEGVALKTLLPPPPRPCCYTLKPNDQESTAYKARFIEHCALIFKAIELIFAVYSFHRQGIGCGKKIWEEKSVRTRWQKDALFIDFFREFLKIQ